MDVTDNAGCKLALRIGEKAAEVFGTDNPDKTLGQWRGELAELVTEAMWFKAAHEKACRGEK